MSLGVRHGLHFLPCLLNFCHQIHYNQGGDLLTYLDDPSVFEIKEGFVKALEGPGLGVKVNEQLVRETAANYILEKPWRNQSWRGEDGSLREW
jgi:galactonate dehydratase